MTELIANCAVDPVLAGEAGATVLRLTASDGGVRYLKHGIGDIAVDVADEAHRLAWLQGRVPCAEPIHFVRAAGEAWLLTGAVAGRTGDDWIEHNPTTLPMVIDALAGFLRQLHALPVDECPFDAGAGVRLAAARRRMTAGAVDLDDFDDDHEGWSAERLWDELMCLRPGSYERVVTHGDFSLGNVLIDDAGRVTGCIDVGRMGVADPYQDIAILWQNLREFGDSHAARFVSAYGIDTLDLQRLDFHRCLDEMF
nr:APH(3') family aminoglycoside O-phosphotransferase [Sphingomonas jinjuensis]